MIYYISSSHFPSNQANLIHVLNQAYGFKYLGKQIKLFISSDTVSSKIVSEIKSKFGLAFDEKDFHIISSKSLRLKEIKIAFFSLFHCLFFDKSTYLVSRNLYFSFFYNILNKRKLITEFHHLENTNLRSLIQKSILEDPFSKSVVISKRLEFYLNKKFNINNYRIFHDAARKINFDQYLLKRNKEFLKFLFKNDNSICTYSGSLHKGRGIDLIMKIANSLKNVNFLIIGNNISNIKSTKNLKFIGFKPNLECFYFLQNSDILLMPYQKKVSIGVKNLDTSKWMSPLKLFEYMSMNKPIISSNLPVLREVLINNYNSTLVNPENSLKWIEKIDFLLNNNTVIAENAYKNFCDHFQWNTRADKYLKYFAQI